MEWENKGDTQQSEGAATELEGNFYQLNIQRQGARGMFNKQAQKELPN